MYLEIIGFKTSFKDTTSLAIEQQFIKNKLSLVVLTNISN
jgi:hypothetical protein